MWDLRCSPSVSCFSCRVAVHRELVAGAILLQITAVWSQRFRVILLWVPSTLHVSFLLLPLTCWAHDTMVDLWTTSVRIIASFPTANRSRFKISLPCNRDLLIIDITTQSGLISLSLTGPGIYNRVFIFVNDSLVVISQTCEFRATSDRGGHHTHGQLCLAIDKSSCSHKSSYMHC